MFEIVIGVLGIVAAAIYVGYFAYAIGAVPLWVIVVGTFALMIREFVLEFRESGKRSARNNGTNGGS